jgi:hypothetical protein
LLDATGPAQLRSALSLSKRHEPFRVCDLSFSGRRGCWRRDGRPSSSPICSRLDVGCDSSRAGIRDWPLSRPDPPCYRTPRQKSKLTVLADGSHFGHRLFLAIILRLFCHMAWSDCVCMLWFNDSLERTLTSRSAFGEFIAPWRPVRAVHPARSGRPQIVEERMVSRASMRGLGTGYSPIECLEHRMTTTLKV